MTLLSITRYLLFTLGSLFLFAPFDITKDLSEGNNEGVIVLTFSLLMIFGAGLLSGISEIVEAVKEKG